MEEVGLWEELPITGRNWRRRGRQLLWKPAARKNESMPQRIGSPEVNRGSIYGNGDYAGTVGRK